VTAARETVAEIIAEREQRTYRECVYCSRPSFGLACIDHRDLLWVDDHYYAMRLRNDSNQSFASAEGAHTQ
jgi:hypothetical protein